MQCTPESNVYLESCKHQHSRDCSDSGYSGSFHSPQSVSRVDSCNRLSPGEFSETSKENLRLPVTPKERSREPLGFLGKDYRALQRPSTVNWCETPKRDSALRQRRLMCRPTTAAENARSPCTRGTEASIGSRPAQWLSASFDSLDAVTGAFASSTLKLEQDLPLSGRKRRLLFTQVRTSTLEDGKVNSGHLSVFGRRISLSDAESSENISASDQINTEAPSVGKFLPASSKDDCKSPISSVNNLCNSVLCTPSSTYTPKYIRYVLS